MKSGKIIQKQGSDYYVLGFGEEGLLVQEDARRCEGSDSKENGVNTYGNATRNQGLS